MSKPKEDTGDNVSPGARHLVSFLQRVEKLEEEKRDLAEDVKQVYLEAKSSGFDVRTIREIVKRRRMKQADREERDALLATYETNIDSILE